MTEAMDVTESEFVFFHPSLHLASPRLGRIWLVMPVTERRSRMCDTHVVIMVRKTSKKAFLEPGDTRLPWTGEAAANFVCIGIASGRALPTS